MQILLIIITLIAFFIAQALIGGAKVIFALPAYIVIAVAGIISIISLFRKRNVGTRNLPVISTVLLAGYVLWRAFTSPVLGLALPDILMTLGALCAYLLLALHVVSPKARLWLLAGCFVLGFFHVAASVMQFHYEEDFMFASFLPDWFPIPQIFRGSGGWRASGFYVCPNHTAGFLESIGAFAVAYCCWGRFTAFWRIVLGYVVAYCIVGIALTGSRGGYLSTAFGFSVLVCISLWFLKKLRSERFGMMMVAAFVLGVAVIGGAAFGMSRSATLGNRMNEISADANGLRFDMWEAALKQHKVSPVCGTGAGTYVYYGRHFRTPNVQRDPIHAHCDYLELLAEYGVVGCVLMAFFIGAHIYSGATAAMDILKNRLRATGRSFSNELAVIAGALAMTAALLAHSVVDFNFHLPANTLFFAAIFGILACPTSDPKLLKSPKPSWVARFAGLLLPAVSVFLMVKSLDVFRGEYHAEWARVHLRNKLFYDNLGAFQSSLGWSLAPMSAGMIAPASGTEATWSIQYQKAHLLPLIQREAEQSTRYEPSNLDAHYYAGEARSLMAVYASDAASRKAHREAALAEFEAGHQLFPQDGKYLLKQGWMLSNLGRFEGAEAAIAKAIAADPNFGNGYAFYGMVLWQQKKLVRAEAYYRKALSFPFGNDFAAAALRDVVAVRALAADSAHTERFGDPLEDYDMEPLTDEDGARGVGVAQ